MRIGRTLDRLGTAFRHAGLGWFAPTPADRRMAFLLGVLAGGCSLIVPGADDFTYDLDDAGQDAGESMDAEPPDAGRDGGATDASECLRTADCPTRPSADAACIDARCEYTCVDGQGDCDGDASNGCEQDVLGSREHCGACGTSCAWACAAGVCDDPVEIAAGARHTCVRRTSGSVYCWGNNAAGQLGDGTDVISRPTPVRVMGLDDAASISSRFFHACAARTSGDVVCWGQNNRGQLGNGTVSDSNVPVNVLSLGSAGEVAAGGSYSCAARTTGEVLCWGSNRNGQLGDGTTMDSTTPVLVRDFIGPSLLTSGGGHTCLESAVGAECWGSNDSGQLGDGTFVDRSSPVPVADPLGATMLSAGGFHTCARTSGGIQCWGNNIAGQIGDGTMTNRSRPVSVMVGIARSVSCGAAHTCALNGTGTVSCWGSNMNGQLGDGTGFDRLIPTEVPGLADVVEVTAGWFHTCARRASGEILCWGEGVYGQLGDGVMEDRLSPVPVMPP